MTIASMIIQPSLGQLDQVAARLSATDGVTVHTATHNQQVIIVVEAPSLSDISDIARNIEQQEGVSGVYPTYIYDDV